MSDPSRASSPRCGRSPRGRCCSDGCSTRSSDALAAIRRTVLRGRRTPAVHAASSRAGTAWTTSTSRSSTGRPSTQLGGADEILDAAKHHWRGVTAQLTDVGMLTDEYENGYDWFHQGESLIFFYALCAADPDDAEFRERARRFAELYLDPAKGNYDPVANVILRAAQRCARPARGRRRRMGVRTRRARTTCGPTVFPSRGSRASTSGTTWRIRRRPTSWAPRCDAARTGDVAVNLAATSLIANHWLYDGDQRAAEWIAAVRRRMARPRAARTAACCPTTSVPTGSSVSLQDGHWYGGHYGWTWPHGLPCVGMAALIGAMNAATVTGDRRLPRARSGSAGHGDRSRHHRRPLRTTPMSLQANSLSRLGEDAANPAQLVPHRYGVDGWFDFGPMPMELPTWLWWFSRDSADLERLRRLMSVQSESSTAVKPFRDKAEGGHDMPWLSFLAGENPDYPERALSMALGQVARRVALMETEHPDPATVHIHFWQRVQPVVTEVLRSADLRCTADPLQRWAAARRGELRRRRSRTARAAAGCRGPVLDRRRATIAGRAREPVLSRAASCACSSRRDSVSATSARSLHR